MRKSINNTMYGIIYLQQLTLIGGTCLTPKEMLLGMLLTLLVGALEVGGGCGIPLRQ